MNTTLEFKWTVSRARDSYGYNICTLYADGRKVGRCNGGGYDMKGTSLGSFIERRYADRLLELKTKQMPKNSHWERIEPVPMMCKDLECLIGNRNLRDDLNYTQEKTCRHCGKPTEKDYNAGKRVNDGRYFYGLTFHDPDYDPGKAVVGKDCHNRSLGGEDGKTVEQLEAEGKTVGLERYQAFYSASSKTPSKRHRIPLIDGACGISSVESIMKAIGLTMEYIPTRKRDDSLYQLHDKREGNPSQ